MKRSLFLALLLASPVAFSQAPTALAAPETQATADLKAAITKAIETNNVAEAQKLIAKTHRQSSARFNRALGGVSLPPRPTLCGR